MSISTEPEKRALVTPRVVPTETRKTTNSLALYEESRNLIPGGSSSILRWASYEPYPIAMKRGRGSHIFDADDNEYIDYLLAYGAVINGHAHPIVSESLKRQIDNGTMFGTPNELELKLAKKFNEMVGSHHMVVFANSGSEATSNAIRIARAATGKDMILKFEGHYHGQHDYAMISVESPPPVSGLEDNPRPLPYSAGIPSLVLDTVIVAPWNNPHALERIMKRHRNEVAAIIMEPIMANSTVIPPANNYLSAAKEIAASNDALLIFDEVITGFRVSPSGAQGLYGVTPDLATWGKALGGGVPIAAISGKKEYMDLIGPGKVNYGGTYVANPLSMAGAVANLEVLSSNNSESFSYLRRATEKLVAGINEQANSASQKVCVQGAPGMLSVSFTKSMKIMNYRESLLTDWNKYRMLHQLLLEKGIYLHPDNYERLVLSTVHTEEDLERTTRAFGECFRQLHEKYD